VSKKVVVEKRFISQYSNLNIFDQLESSQHHHVALRTTLSRLSDVEAHYHVSSRFRLGQVRLVTPLDTNSRLYA
jgi:hypothetical protein